MRFIFPFIKPSHSKLRPAISYQLSSSIPHSEEKRIIWIWTINNGHSKNKIGKLWSMSLKMVTYSMDLAKGVQKISLFIHIHERSYWIIRTWMPLCQSIHRRLNEKFDWIATLSRCKMHNTWMISFYSLCLDFRVYSWIEILLSCCQFQLKNIKLVLRFVKNKQLQKENTFKIWLFQFFHQRRTLVPSEIWNQ